MTASKIAYVIDFDGTVTEVDITSTMARHFGKEHYIKCSAAYKRGEFGMKEWLARMSAFLPPDPAELMEFARLRAALRPGAKEFFQYARSGERPVYIASDGFGLYIEPILEMHGCREYVAGIFCNRTLPGNGRLETITPHAHESCPVCGNCKAAHVIGLQEEGYRVIYVGDGMNDRFGAAHADAVFARDRLAEICSAAGIPFQRWDDFFDLIETNAPVKNNRNRKFCNPAGEGFYKNSPL
ncbi:MAG TPA: MtnX-like HAD-IB family phosphatase [Bacillota bacterium]|nr:MtnX-like HAD-IB family phosphatase [Bacillota bacterium]HOA35415.1 MtnX-like HAD-IB family phosphatase [Bacillota bacterium]HOJ84263.1 MtnX-like HAD-IB family phosphatase [Bacillota bacterium]HOL15108.1 MtnX-like HAD-IB family phosphatase [Bacillota bacterium]HPZ11580.1 MtnX-like HAD-IB family phosphatase [Bacillota bacterium]